MVPYLESDLVLAYLQNALAAFYNQQGPHTEQLLQHAIELAARGGVQILLHLCISLLVWGWMWG